MLYLVSEYAPNGEIFGELALDMREGGGGGGYSGS